MGRDGALATTCKQARLQSDLPAAFLSRVSFRFLVKFCKNTFRIILPIIFALISLGLHKFIIRLGFHLLLNSANIYWVSCNSFVSSTRLEHLAQARMGWVKEIRTTCFLVSIVALTRWTLTKYSAFSKSFHLHAKHSHLYISNPTCFSEP